MNGVRVLGEIEVVADDGLTAAVGSPKQRLLLALLAAAGGGPLSADRLIEGLWGEEPPPTARATLTGYVSRLRSALGPGAIEGSPLGYRLRVDEIDAHRFEATVEQALACESPDQLAGALDSWSGDPFAEFADHPFLIGVSTRLRELRTSARVRLAALYLESGDNARPISMLEAVVQEDPVREDAWVLLVRSLLVGGRPADALRAAHRCRRELAEVGLDPAEELVALEAQALGQRTAPSSPGDTAPEVDVGPVRYVRNGDIHLGYQTTGGGLSDLILSSYGSVSIDAFWDDHRFSGFIRHLGAGCRVVLYDTRGIGLSDPIDPSSPPSIPAQSDDLMSVIDAAKATRPVLVGIGDGGSTVITTAHRHPRRIAGMVLINTFARLSHTDDYPIGIPPEVLTANIAATTDHATERDTSHVLRNHAPSVASDPEFRRWWERAGRRGASPATASALWRVRYGADVRSLLPELTTPTLVIHSARARAVPRVFGRYLAESIPNATFAEIDTADQSPFTEPADEIAKLVVRFANACGR